MRNQTILTVMGGVGACAMVLSQACSTSPATTADGGGGEEALGGSSTGGKPAAAPGTGGGSDPVDSAKLQGDGLGGGSSLACGPDTWLDETLDTCADCADVVSYPSTCDFYGTQGSMWNAATQTLTLELKSGLPNITSARLYVSYYYDTDDEYHYVGKYLPVSIAGDTLKVNFRSFEAPVGQLTYYGTSLVITNDCGVETSLNGFEVYSGYLYNSCEF